MQRQIEKLLFLDCSRGARGDLILAALIDVGASLPSIEDQLSNLKIEPFSLELEQVSMAGVPATRTIITSEADSVVRYWPNIRELLLSSDLSPNVKEGSLVALSRLAEAEAHAYKQTMDKVHFHEAGVTDAIVQTVAIATALEDLSLDRVISSPIATGSGAVKTAHGSLPIPTPTTAFLLRGATIYSGDSSRELTDPIGAAVLSTIVDDYSDMPFMTLAATGYGAGRDDIVTTRFLRAMIGSRDLARLEGESGEDLVELEADLFDLSPELLPYVVEQAMRAGAINAWFTPVTTINGRPGTILTAVATGETFPGVAEALIKESSTHGVRYRTVRQSKMRQSREKVKVSGREIAVSVGWMNGHPEQITPEYTDCRSAAELLGVPIKDVVEEARVRARQTLETELHPID